ncbi:MAG TPA: HEAT repeat domain-containing protein [Planctomycetota bacterium]|nr:HEAT repeat domain-containing protein [Planctomycetota bacterium]
MRLSPGNILFHVTLALAGLLHALPAQAENEAKAEAALKEFGGYYSHQNEHVRKAAVEGLMGVDHHTVTAQLLKVLTDPSEAVRKSAIMALGTQRNMLGTSELIKRAWKGRNKEERLAILQAFRLSKPDQAYTILLDLLQDKDWQLRHAAVECITAFGDRDGATLGSLIPLASDKEALVRLAVVQGFLELNNPRCHPTAVERLKDSDWRVQSAAIKICRNYRQKASIGPLIDLLGTTQGRLLDDITQTLQDLCDRDMPGDAAEWKKWWAKVGEGFQVPTAEQIKERRRKESESRRGYDPPRKSDYPPYHGIKTNSRRMLFVVDISGSMAEHLVLNRNDRDSMAAFQERYGHLNTTIKIDIAREELINIVAGLKPHARFNIVTFNSEVQRFEDSLVPATGDHKNRAIKFLARLQPAALAPVSRAVTLGQTNTFEAINSCFGIFKGDTWDPKVSKSEADTVFFLSDGNPTTGRITDPQELVNYFRTVNKRGEMVVHTISFGASNKGLMEGIALASGGQSVMIGN